MKQPFPGTITALVAQSRTRRILGERINIFVDEKFSFALDMRLVEKYKLARGMEVNAALLSQLLREDGDAKATNRALHFLGYRARSEAEVRARLQRDEWPDEVIARVLVRLREQGFLNDEKFAENWVESRSHSRPRGARMLQQELRQKGVERETIDAALPDDEAEMENAIFALQKLLRSKERAWQNLEEKEKREKAIAFLMRRGFNYAVAKNAWTKTLEES
jgi:regulatory protein